VSIIDMGSRSVIATAGFAGVAQTGSHLRLNTGMDFEPEYIAVNAAGTKAFVSVQEANGLAVLDLGTNQFEKVVGLGAKDFNAPGNEIDSLNNSTVSFANVAAKGLYMPDAVATYQAGGRTFVVMANEGDFREDNGDRSAASGLGATGLLANLRVSNTESSAGNLFAAGARSFSIRDTDGNLVYDSGSILDREAARLGIYDDDRSRDKGVEPEGVEILSVDGRTLAFIGLERTTTAAVAVFDVTDPNAVSYLDMIVTDGDVAPEGLEAFTVGGRHFLAISNEVSNTTTVYNLAAVPEPSTWAMLGAGLGLLGFAARRRRA
jgi:DNA-binding beta-propeller fold protein YncE